MRLASIQPQLSLGASTREYLPKSFLMWELATRLMLVLPAMWRMTTSSGAWSLLVRLQEQKWSSSWVIQHVVLGNLTGLLARIKPAIPATKFEGDKSSKNPAYVDAVAKTNVELTLDNIRRRSPVLADLEKKGSIKITGAMYDLATGAVEFNQ